MECFYLLRQCKQFKYDESPQYSPYYNALEKYYKKVAHKSTKVEEQIVELLEANDFAQVSVMYVCSLL